MAYAHKKARRQKRKADLVNMFGGSCARCGSIFPPECFDFHHLDHSKKRFTLGQQELGSRTWDALVAEANKCVLVCACCHRSIHTNKEERWLHAGTNRRH